MRSMSSRARSDCVPDPGRLLDIEGDAAQLGKATGADRALDKPTYPSCVGVEPARRRMHELHSHALARSASRIARGAAGERFRLAGAAQVLSFFTVDSRSMGSATPYPLLSSIGSPADLRALTPAKLKKLDGAAAVPHRHGRADGRSLRRRPRHRRAHRALHYVFNTPHDRIVWDVGTRRIRTRC
jgi:hypothetical protein